ncbi:MAG: TetR/AcrR family transcriptional regulator [Clostridiaceae bacterium]|jgi:AcrR family transcriptional regulator|nr:TetR/AcrR family transcriptional regulator [Clostridiaceae bacterium]
MSSRFYSQTFANISPEKRDSVFTAAISAFAEEGYDAANINEIARLAGISIGSMYSYFDSKEDLFLAMVEKGLNLLNRAMLECRPDEGTIAEVLERIFRVTVRYTEEHPDMCRLYLLISTDNMKSQTERLSEEAEVDFLDMYKRVLKSALQRGEIRADIDIDAAAFFIDNITVMLQFSLTSRYYQHRMENYLGEKAAADREHIIQRTLDFVCRGLGIQPES